MIGVSLCVPVELWHPVSLLGLWRPNNFARTIGMLVPEAPMDKDHLAAAGKYEVRLARQSLTVEAVPITERVNSAPDSHLNRRTLASNTPHIIAPAFWSDSIHLHREIERQIRDVLQAFTGRHYLKKLC